MDSTLKPYQEYKDSGLPWLGQMPTSWEIARTKTCFRLSTEKSGKLHGKELLSVYTHIGVRPRKDLEAKGNKATTTDDYWVVRRGDIIVNKLLAWMGAVGVSHFDGVTSPAYDILRPVKQMEPDYYHFLFRTKLYLQLFKSRSRGIMDMRLRLYFDQLGQIPLIIPPLEQQAAIVRFLDYENARIENVIRAKKKLIILLNEQKQAIIHHAVTRGLNPAVKLKPSGIPWLGDMPKHWEMRPLKHWVKMNELTLGDSTNPNLEIHYIDIGSVKTGKLLHEPEKLLFKDAPSRAKRVLRKGDTIISTVRTYLKAIWYVDQEADSLIASTGFAVLSPRNVVEPEYLHYALQDNNFVDRVTANSIGIAYPAISETVIARFPVALPPSRQEQMELIHFIKNTTAPLSAAISTSEREISLLREYRTRLVADVVTGKLDVRKVAKDLPEESHRSDVSDFSDLVDNRTDLSNGDFEAIAEEES